MLPLLGSHGNEDKQQTNKQKLGKYMLDKEVERRRRECCENRPQKTPWFQMGLYRVSVEPFSSSLSVRRLKGSTRFV